MEEFLTAVDVASIRIIKRGYLYFATSLVETSRGKAILKQMMSIGERHGFGLTKANARIVLKPAYITRLSHVFPY